MAPDAAAHGRMGSIAVEHVTQRSGCGKSTILGLIAGLVPVATGLTVG